MARMRLRSVMMNFHPTSTSMIPSSLKSWEDLLVSPTFSFHRRPWKHLIRVGNIRLSFSLPSCCFYKHDPSCETGMAETVKKSKRNKKGVEQLSAEEEAELEKQKVSTIISYSLCKG